MNTLDDLLIVVPGLRKARRLNAETLRLLLDRPPGSCTWCGALVKKGRRTWCSDACVTAFNLRCSPNHARSYVIARDRDICQLCGFMTYGAQAARRRAIEVLRSRDMTPYAYQVALREIDELYHFARGVHREVDHTVPVIEGGGLCRVEDLRLVCGTCHARETAVLAGRRSKRSRRNKNV